MRARTRGGRVGGAAGEGRGKFAIFAPVCVPVLWLLWDSTRYLLRRVRSEQEEPEE